MKDTSACFREEGEVFGSRGPGYDDAFEGKEEVDGEGGGFVQCIAEDGADVHFAGNACGPLDGEDGVAAVFFFTELLILPEYFPEVVEFVFANWEDEFVGFEGDEEVDEVFGLSVGDAFFSQHVCADAGEEEVLFFGIDDPRGWGEGCKDAFCKAFDGCYVVLEDGAFFAEFLYGGVCKRGVFEEDPCSEGIGFREGCVFGEDGGEGVHM